MDKLAAPRAPSSVQPLTLPGWRQALKNTWKLTALPYLLFILIPLAALFLRTRPDSLFEHLRQEVVWQAIQTSLATSLVAVCLTILFGTPVAYYLSHRRYRFFRLVDTLVDLPSVLPPAVAGVALLIAFGRRGLLGGSLSAMGVELPFTSAAVILAQVFVAAPLYSKSAALGFHSVDCELKKAAALDGAGRWQTLRYVMIPISWPALVSGCVMTWARALGEFGATIIFAGNFPGRTQTMPLAIFIGFELDLDVALALSVILIGFSFLALVIAKVFLQSPRLTPADEAYD
jgi:molybdate transport system permease protein